MSFPSPPQVGFGFGPLPIPAGAADVEAHSGNFRPYENPPVADVCSHGVSPAAAVPGVPTDRLLAAIELYRSASGSKA